MKSLKTLMFYVLTITSFCYITYITFAHANPYNYKILRVIDGDTMEIEVPFLPPELGNNIHLRIDGVDTPEHGFRAKCIKEQTRADAAIEFVKNEIKIAKEVRVLFKTWDKYGGRIDGDIILDEKPLSKKLLEKGYAVEYHGGTKVTDWCK